MITWYAKRSFRDIRRNKGRFILSVLAIGLSITMLVGLVEMVDYQGQYYIERSVSYVSEADIIVTSKDAKFISNVSELEPIFQNSSIRGVTKRYQIDATILVTENTDNPISVPITLLGMNLTYENELELGEFTPEINSLSLNECIVIGEFGHQLINYFGNELNIRAFFPTDEAVNLTLDIKQKITQYRRIPQSLWNVAIVDLETLYQIVDEDSCTSIVGIFEDHEEIYSLIDIEKSIKTIKNRGETIQAKLGFDYVVELPLAQILDGAEAFLANQRSFMLNLGLIMFLISTVLIYSLTSTSIEQKTHEFAIQRAIGAKNRSIILQGLTHALIVVIIGTLVGFLGSILVIDTALPSDYDFSIDITMNTTINTCTIGFVIGLLASIYPILKSNRKQILVGLDLSRSSSTEFTSRISSFRKRWISWKQVSYGAILAFFPFYFLVLLSIVRFYYGEPGVNNLALILFFIAIIGCILLGLGLFSPIFERLFLGLMSFTSKKASFSVQLFMRKNLRRNSLTVSIFALCFAFIFFFNTLIVGQMQMYIYEIKEQTGSDLQIYSYGLDESQWLGQNVQNFTSHYKGIKSSKMTVNGLYSIIGCNVKLGDYLFFKSYYPGLYGTDQNLTEALFSEISFRGGSEFDRIEENGTIVISGSLARELELSVGDSIRVEVDSSIEAARKKYQKDLFLEIVAIATRVPGLPGISDNTNDIGRTSVLIGKKTWDHLVSPIDGSNHTLRMEDYIQRIFVKGNSQTIQEFREALYIEYGTKIYSIVYEEVYNQIKRSIDMSSMFLTIILSLSEIIALFAVISATSTTVHESRKDIGILKAIGLRNKDISRIFYVESIILCLIGTFIGAFAGYFTGYMLLINNSVWQNIPIPTILPSPIVIFSYILAIILALVGTYFPSRAISKLQSTEILR